MNQIIVQREIAINAPLADVWPLVATEEGLRQWWGNTIALEAKAGGRCEEWRIERNRVIHWQGVVTHFAPPHQLTMTLRAQTPSMSEPMLASIDIALEGNEHQTRVHVTHRAFAYDAAIATETLPGPMSLPAPNVPLAQLDRPAPGARPMPAPALPTGQIQPPHFLVDRDQREALLAMWQARLNGLNARVAA